MAQKPYENHLHDTEPRWFAVKTRFRSEKFVFKNLQRKHITVFLPLQVTTKKYQGRIRKVEIPLIHCYIFVKITKKDYVKVLETERVIGFVNFAKNLLSIPEEEIELVRKLIGEGWKIEAQLTNFSAGDEVEINQGRLTGLRGKLIDKSNERQFVVELDNLGYSLLIEIDKQLLSKV